jgi:ABC-type transporter MlaC component
MRHFKTLALVLAVLLTAALVMGGAAHAQNRSPQAEAFINTQIRAGLDILKDTAAAPDQRAGQFQTFLLGVTDIKRIALFTLGSYAGKASPADQDAFVQAFQNYAVAVYRSYFMMYSGQSLSVTGSQLRSPDDAIVATTMADPSGQDAAQDRFPRPHRQRQAGHHRYRFFRHVAGPGATG